MARRLPTIAALLIAAALLAWVQFSFDGLFDSDSYFHTRAARELQQHGFRRQFPQAAFSTWSERYSDKDLLFHLVLIPFQQIHLAGAGSLEPGTEDLVTPGKQAAVALTLAFFASFAFALGALGARAPWFWMLLLFTADMAFLKAFMPVRPGLLAMSFIVLEVVLLIRGRGRWLAVVGALHAYAHTSFVLLPALVAAAAVARLLRRESFPKHLAAWALAGPAVASIVHPYFPNNLFIAWDQIVEVSRAVWWGGTPIPRELFGPELLATRTDLFLRGYPAFVPAVAGIVAFLASTTRRLSTAGLALLLMTGVLLVPALMSERFLDFFFPTVVLLGACLWSELAGSEPLGAICRRARAGFLAGTAVLSACLLVGFWRGGVVMLWDQMRAMTTAEVQRPAIEFLRRTAKPEDLVYHNFWWDFSILYHYRPDGRYVVALDPVFFWRRDPQRFLQALAAYRGETADLYRVLREDFGARWVYLPKAPGHLRFFERMRGDSRFQKAYEDEQVAIARLP